MITELTKCLNFVKLSGKFHDLGKQGQANNILVEDKLCSPTK